MTIVAETNFTLMPHAICCIPVSPLRLEPSHKAEMVSQQLFGETCMVTDRAKGNWLRVQCRYDGYEGWCQEGHVALITEALFGSAVKYLTAGWVNALEYNGQKMQVPMGASLAGWQNGQASWGGNTICFSGETLVPGEANCSVETIRQLAFSFLNTAYLWGGKSVFGIDCSGFVQTIYKFAGCFLYRDAHQQAAQGNMVGFLQEARCGDLAFFDNEEGKITHVGMLLNDHEIIHASVKVRVDGIDNYGIVNTGTGKRTHRLRIIKRHF